MVNEVEHLQRFTPPHYSQLDCRVDATAWSRAAQLVLAGHGRPIRATGLTGRAYERSQALDRVDDSLVPEGLHGLLNGRARQPRFLDQGMLTGNRLARLIQPGG